MLAFTQTQVKLLEDVAAELTRLDGIVWEVQVYTHEDAPNTYRLTNAMGEQLMVSAYDPAPKTYEPRRAQFIGCVPYELFIQMERNEEEPVATASFTRSAKSIAKQIYTCLLPDFSALLKELKRRNQTAKDYETRKHLLVVRMTDAFGRWPVYERRDYYELTTFSDSETVNFKPVVPEDVTLDSEYVNIELKRLSPELAEKVLKLMASELNK